MLSPLRPLHLSMRSRAGRYRGWLPLFYIWAVQWIVNGTIKWYGDWKVPGWLPSATALAAALASIGLLLCSSLPVCSGCPVRRSVSLWVIVPFGVAAGSLMLLEYVHAVDPFFLDLFRTLHLAFFLSCLGVLFGLELLLLGVWLFAVCLVTSVWFLGFAPMVLGFMGGLSLLACGWILSRWSKPGAPASS